jgi:hypothetical protein
MKSTQKEFRTILERISNKTDLVGYDGIRNHAFPELVRIITHHLFVKNINQYFIQDDILYNDINLLREYCLELKTGEVNFV